MTTKELLEEIKRIKTLADIGLLYCNNNYDKERYTELHQASLRLLSRIGGNEIADLHAMYPIVTDYPTVKVDIRGLILSPDQKILLVQEADGKWSLPGGWAEIGCSPKETIIKECKEETGLDVVPQKLLAVFDKRFHPHPPEGFYVYKMVFHCEAMSFLDTTGFDMLNVDFFPIDELPPLSENRILRSQLHIVYNKIMNGNEVTYFD